MSNRIKIEPVDRTIIIRFVRSELRNPLSEGVLSEIHDVLDLAANEERVERIVFTGENGVFASGADLREIDRLSVADAPDFSRLGQALMDRIERCRPMTVAAINGFCFGGALDLALACRLRVGSHGSTYCHPGAGLGIITGWGGTQRLPRLVGEANALEMFFTAEPISAEQALRIGLIDRIANDPLTECLNPLYPPI